VLATVGSMGALVVTGFVLLFAILIALGAVWFGRSIVAPRIVRALDRAEADEEEPGDRAD
jgi:hypothetical protein